VSVDMFLDITYSGKAADTWAVGVTLYCMVLGDYPFLGDTLQDTYDRVRNLVCFLFLFSAIDFVNFGLFCFYSSFEPCFQFSSLFLQNF
jgi:serine/threonine protein kinase